MKRILVCIIVTMIIVCFALGFIQKENVTKVECNHIVFASKDIPNNLKKVGSLSKEYENIICAVSRGLVTLNTKDGIEPSLAASYSISNDGIEYNFVIREDVYWSDGSKITADNYREYFQKLLNIEDEESISALLNIYGAKEFRQGKGSFDKLVAISCEENTLKIRLNEKSNDFLKELTKPQYRIRKYPEIWGDVMSMNKSMIYSGEYMIDSVNDDSITLTKNKYIKDKVASTIKYKKDESSELSMASYEVGERDVVYNPPVSELNKLNKEGKIKTSDSNKGIYLAIQKDKRLSLDDRRGLYKIIYDATEKYESSNSKSIKAANGSYFRDDLKDLNKIQSRKKAIIDNIEWNKPNKLKLAVINSCDINTYCNYLIDYFKKNGILLECYYLEESIDGDYLNDNYDMCIFSKESNSKDKEKLYDSFKEITNIKFSSKNKEEELFSSYTLLPIMFLNDNIAISDKILEINFDGNGNIDFSSIKENRVEL